MNDLTNETEILEYLHSLTEIGEIKESEMADEWIKKYDELYLGGNSLGYSFDTANGNYIIEITGNLVAERLYYYIRDNSGNTLQSFQPLLEYPFNLLTANAFIGEKLYYKNNKLYKD